MFRKITSLTLIGLIINLMLVNFAYAESKPEKEARFTEKIKQGVSRIGTGEQAQIEVKLRDKTKLKGYVKEINNESFTIVEAKSGIPATISYPQVKQVKGNNLSTGAKIAIGVGIGFGIALLIALIIASSDD